MTDDGRFPGHAEEPDKFWFIEQLREAVGLPGPPLPITPKQAWEEAIAVVRRVCGQRPIDQFFDEFDPELNDGRDDA